MNGEMWGCRIGNTLGVCSQDAGSHVISCGNAILGTDDEDFICLLLEKYRLVNESEFMGAVMALREARDGH